MNEFLENLELGESKIKLSKEEIKQIMAKHGETIKVETQKIKDEYETKVNEANNTIDSLKKQIENSPDPKELESLKTTIADYEKAENERIEAEKSRQKEEALMANINEAIEGKKFVNDFTKESIINELKNQIADEKNVGKSVKDLFENFVKDRNDIFKSENEVSSVPPMGEIENVATKKQTEIRINPLLRQ